jgi:hypothetical protein
MTARTRKRSAKQRPDYTIGLDEGLDMYDEAEELALEKLEDLGLAESLTPPVTKDGDRFDGRIPANLFSMGAGDIGYYYNLMVQHTTWVAKERVLAESAMIAAKEKLTLAEAAVRKTKTGTVQERRDSTLCEFRYVEANSNWIAAKTFFENLKNVEEAARRDMSFISRLIETKKIEWEQVRRESNVDRPSPGPRSFGRSGRTGRPRGRSKYKRKGDE